MVPQTRINEARFRNVLKKVMTNQILTRTENALDMAAEEVSKEIVSLMRQPKTGKKYPWLPRRSSAAGEAPAIQWGNLKSAVAWRRVSPLVRRVGYIGGDAETNHIGFILEYHMNRPAVNMAMITIEPRLKKILNQGFKLRGGVYSSGTNFSGD